MKRYLNKIILINSAVFDLAEIELDGHTCIIGANNRGKTTLLRTIAFFYNPSNRKSELGIKSVEQDFAKFYFNDHAPSYLIYEVATNRGNFQVVFYKSGGFLNYRFIQAPYERAHYFDDQNETMPLLINEVLKKLSQQTIWHSNEMKEWHEYRSVLYGKYRASKKNSQKPLEQLYLFRGENQADNIPKIIRDIFLNSNPRFAKELKSDFIKAFITNAVSDKTRKENQEFAINLSNLSVELDNYLNHFEDIRVFRKTSFERANINDKFKDIKSKKEAQLILAEKLGSAIKYAQNQLELIDSEQETLSEQLNVKKNELADFVKQNDLEKEQWIEKKGHLKHKLSIAEAAKSVWDSEYFQTNYEQYLKQPALISQLEQEKGEMEILKATHQDVHVKYEQRFKNLKNEQDAFLTKWKERKGDILNEHTEKINQLADIERSVIDEVKQKYEKKQSGLKNELTQFTIELEKLKAQADIIKKEKYFEQEIQQLQKEKSQKKLESVAVEHQINSKEKELSEWKNRDIPALELTCQQAIERKEETIKQQENALNKEIEDIQNRIKISPDSLYGYLNEHVPNWFNTIGKVCDESVLFKTNLNPKQVEEISQTLYGLSLDLDKLSVISKSLEEYQQEITEKQAIITDLHQEFMHFQEAQWSKRNQEIDVFRKKIVEGNRAIEKLRHEKNLLQKRIENITDSIIDYKHQAAERIELESKGNLSLQNETQQKLDTIQTQIEANNAAENEEISTIKTSNESERKLLIDQKETQVGKLQAEREEQELKWKSKNAEIEQERKAELAGKGADMSVLNKLEASIDTIKQLLKGINKFKAKSWKDGEGTYEHFIQHHKPNSIDQLPKLYQEQHQIETALAELNTQKRSFQANYETETKSLRQQVEENTRKLDKFQNGLNKYQNFQHESRIWHQYRKIIFQAENVKVDESIDDLIMQLNFSDQHLTNAYNGFRQMTLKLMAQFRTANSFGLKLTDENKDSAYDKLALELDQIQEQQTIEKIEQQTLQQKVQLVNLIHRQISSLKSQLGKVRKAVNNISNDIANSGFTNANLIVSFEMKVEETNNRVMLQMEKLANLREEHGQAFHDLAYGGELIGHELDKQSTKILESLKVIIDDSKQEVLRLQDMFELAFSYDDKRNKKTNVTSIDDIGSEGTTVLIKACIYISLLHFFAKQAKTFNQETYLHCIIDEVGKISEPYLKTLLEFAYERHIYLLNALPNKSKLETYYNYTYKLREVSYQDHFIAKVDRLLSKKVSLKSHV